MKLLPQASHLCGFPPRGPPCWVPRPEPRLRPPASSAVRPELPSVPEAPCNPSQVSLFWERGPALGVWPADRSRLGSCPKRSPPPGLRGSLLSRVLSTPPAWCTSSSGPCGLGDDGACSGSDSEPETRGGGLSEAVPHGTLSHPGCLRQGGSGRDVVGCSGAGRTGVQTRSQAEKALLPRLLVRDASACHVLSEEAPLQAPAAPELLQGPPGDTTRASLGERWGRVGQQRNEGLSAWTGEARSRPWGERDAARA